MSNILTVMANATVKIIKIERLLKAYPDSDITADDCIVEIARIVYGLK